MTQYLSFHGVVDGLVFRINRFFGSQKALQRRDRCVFFSKYYAVAEFECVCLTLCPLRQKLQFYKVICTTDYFANRIRYFNFIFDTIFNSTIVQLSKLELSGAPFSVPVRTPRLKFCLTNVTSSTHSRVSSPLV